MNAELVPLLTPESVSTKYKSIKDNVNNVSSKSNHLYTAALYNNDPSEIIKEFHNYKVPKNGTLKLPDNRSFAVSTQ